MARAALIHCFDALVAPSSAVTLKPATCGHFKTGHFGWQCHDQLVVRRREIQQIGRAGHRFCASTEGTEVFALKRFF